MRIVAESQAVGRPSYVHLAYVSAETAVTFFLGAAIILGLVLGLVILVRGAFSAWQNRKAKLSKSSKTAGAERMAEHDATPR